MNDHHTNTRKIPVRAIVIYKMGSEYNSDYYLECYEIKKKGNNYEPMAPVPMATPVIKDLASTMLKSNTINIEFGGMIAEHLLYGMNKPGHTVVMWYRPAMVRALNFSGSLKIKGDTSVNIPATLYLVVNNKLYLFALMDNDRPSGKTKLFNAPFFNIYADGNVCLGTAPIGKVRGRTYELEAARFERGFYMAEQNGGGHHPCKTDLQKLWPLLIKNKQAFPGKKELIQHSKFKTVNDLIDKLINQ